MTKNIYSSSTPSGLPRLTLFLNTAFHAVLFFVKFLRDLPYQEYGQLIVNFGSKKLFA